MNRHRWLALLAGASFLLGGLGIAQAADGRRPKYVFLMIGDGMATPQIAAAEAYLAARAARAVGPSARRRRLAMRSLGVVGMSTTYAGNRFITDSAAAGTALACGLKTDVGVVAMAPAGKASYRTIAEAAAATGRSVGIVSSVSIDHATPACFYAHVDSRDRYHDIALQLARSQFDYFAGGGMKGRTRGDVDARAVAVEQGFAFAERLADLRAIPADRRVLCWNAALARDQAMYYEMDRVWLRTHGQTPAEREQISLAQFTAEGIRILGDDPDGFFLMVEGGKIDWACHANDARAAIGDTLAFDDAVGVALRFMNEHPDDTLVVVTGDHECGGMTLGFAGTQYASAFEVLANQTVSYEIFRTRLLAEYLHDFEAAHPGLRQDWPAATRDTDDRIRELIRQAFGLDYATLDKLERAQIEAAYDHTMGLAIPTNADELRRQYLLYGREIEDGAWDGYDPLTVTCTHLLNHRAGISWTTYSHTGIPVPVMAAGCGAKRFEGFYDNTDVAKRLARAMGVALTR